MATPALDQGQLRELSDLRLQLQRGDGATQEQLDAMGARWSAHREHLRNGEKDEVFHLADACGNPTRLLAPRWLCHLLGLRHCCAHILLQWHSPGLGRVFVLQVRSWTRSDSAGHLDISVGGHVSGEGPTTSRETAYREMAEELGLTRADLQEGELVYCRGYENYTARPREHFFNAEWRDVYCGTITTTGLEKISFDDQEVIGLYLCPEAEAGNLLEQQRIPIASGLEYSLPYCL